MKKYDLITLSGFAPAKIDFRLNQGEATIYCLEILYFQYTNLKTNDFYFLGELFKFPKKFVLS